MVNHRSSAPTSMFWNFVGFAIATLSVGMSWSIIQTKVFELEVAQYKLKTGSAINKVQKVSNTLDAAAQTLPIAPKQKKRIRQLTSESRAVIEKAEAQIEQEVKQLIEVELPE